MLDVAARIETPKDAAEVAALVADAHETGRRLEIMGGGTKRGIGQVRSADAVVSLAGLDQVIDYAPQELVLTAQPGVTLDALETLVAAQGQMLPFEPPRLTKLLKAMGKPTLGGALGANLSGPRRLRAGAARDHLLGLTAVTGRGEIVKAGGRVVKNVTGYDLPKLIAGSWGTLAVMTEVTIKVLPAARTQLTLLLFGLSDDSASRAMTVALNAPADISAAAHLPARTAALAPLKGSMAVTALRLEGFEASVAARADHLTAALSSFGRIERLDAAHSADLWTQIREVEALARDPRPLWRISAPPAAGWRIGEQAAGDVLYDWGGGLIWLRSDIPAGDLHALARSLGGHAALYQGDGAGLGPVDGVLGALAARVKAVFDPNGVLNPGRMGGA